jgi:hypothetical protein
METRRTATQNTQQTPSFPEKQTIAQHTTTPTPQINSTQAQLPQTNKQKELDTDDSAFETEFGDELSFLVDNACKIREPPKPQHMPYIY